MPKRAGNYREHRVERWARRIVAGELGLPVARFEDGTRNGMVDAVIRSPVGLVPLEVVRDVNVPEARMAAALRGQGSRLHVDGIPWGWYVSLQHCAKVRDVRKHLPDMLRRIDELRLDRVPWASDSWSMWGSDVPRPIYRLGVQFMAPAESAPGVVLLGGEGWGGFDEPDRLNTWVIEVLERESDVPAKLRAFPGGRGDAFIWATMASDLSVTGLLVDPDEVNYPRTLPERVPDLPPGVDRVWIACTIAGRRAIVSDGRRWRWVGWTTTVDLEAEEGP